MLKIFYSFGGPTYTSRQMIEESDRHREATNRFIASYATSIGADGAFVTFCRISLDRQYPMSTENVQLPYDCPSKETSASRAARLWGERIA